MAHLYPIPANICDLSSQLAPLINELKTGFYRPVITLIGFEYKTQELNTDIEFPTFYFFTHIYKAIKQGLDESLTEAWFERITTNDLQRKIYYFCMHSGDEELTSISEDDTPTTTLRSVFFSDCIENFLGTSSPTVFTLETIGRRSHFHPSAEWGCVLFLFNNTLGNGMIIYANPIF